MFVWDAHGGGPADSGCWFESVEAGHGALLRHANAARLQVLHELVGLVIRRADPGGNAGFLDDAGGRVGDFGRREARAIFVHVQHPFGAEFQAVKKKGFDVAAESASDPMAANRVVPRDETDALVAGGVQAFDERDHGLGVVRINDINAGMVVAFEYRHRGDFSGNHLDRRFRERVDEDRAAPVTVAEVSEKRLAVGLNLKAVRRLIIDVDLDVFHFGAFTNSLQDIGEGRHHDILGGNSDQDADGDRTCASAVAAAGAARALSIAQFLGHGVDFGACLGADRGMVGQAPRHRGAGDIKLGGDEVLIDSGHSRRGASGQARSGWWR